jgi:glutathione S-transferase
MKLYYSPNACSQAPHILLHEIGLSHDAERVDLKSHTLGDGSSYYQVNPKGSVPALELDNGEVLTENAIILQYLGDRAASGVLPPQGDFRRYRVLEMVNFITTELHKRFGFLFNPNATDEMKQLVIRDLGKKLDYIDERLGAGPFLFGDTLTLPDVYLFVITGWTEKMIGLVAWQNLTAFRERMLQRPSVRHVLRFEGLLKEEPAG